MIVRAIAAKEIDGPVPRISPAAARNGVAKWKVFKKGGETVIAEAAVREMTTLARETGQSRIGVHPQMAVARLCPPIVTREDTLENNNNNDGRAHSRSWPKKARAAEEVWLWNYNFQA